MLNSKIGSDYIRMQYRLQFQLFKAAKVDEKSSTVDVQILAKAHVIGTSKLASAGYNGQIGHIDS